MVVRYYQPNAPVIAEATLPVDALPSEEERRKENETARGLPVKSDITSSKISSPDTALTAFCQLVTWRTGAQRAMIGYVD